jgi:hypothetical protein
MMPGTFRGSGDLAERIRVIEDQELLRHLAGVREVHLRKGLLHVGQ